MCMLFAATYPDRTKALILFGCFATRGWAADYPGPILPKNGKVVPADPEEWGGPVEVGERAPSRADDAFFANWSASPFGRVRARARQ